MNIDEEAWRYFSPDDVEAGGGNTTVFSATDVQNVLHQLEDSGVLVKLRSWWEEDHAGKHAGGRPRYLSDVHILTASLLLLGEGSPLWVTEIGAIFWRRLSPEARVLLHLDHVVDTGKASVDQERWRSRAYEAYHRLLENIDAWPAPRRLLTLEDRAEIRSLREQNELRRKEERATAFAGAMMEMTIQMLPRRIRRKLSDVISIDQTAIRAVSPRRRFGIDEKTGQEVPPPGTKHHGLVLELDADLYPTKAYTARVKDAKAKVKRLEISKAEFKRAEKPRGGDLIWAYMANISVTVPPDAATHPVLATTVTVSKPNDAVAQETLDAAASLVDRGHQPRRFTMDQGYVHLTGLAGGLRDLGVERLVAFLPNQLGVKGGYGGSKQVEGEHYCAGLPDHLRDATINKNAGEVSEEEWKELLAERRKYKLRNKERPDAQGRVPKMCPAIGPQATVDCPLREVHAKASKKVRPEVANHPPEDSKPLICDQSSVVFAPDEGVEYAQDLPYGSDEWATAYKRERNAVESYNAALKTEILDIENPLHRRVRGRAAAHYAVVMMAVAVNIRRILRFLRDETKRKARVRRTATMRRRDRDGLSEYARRKARPGREAQPSVPEPDPVLRT